MSFRTTVYVDLRPVAAAEGTTARGAFEAALEALRGCGYANFASRLDEDAGMAELTGGNFGCIILGRPVEFSTQGSAAPGR